MEEGDQLKFFMEVDGARFHASVAETVSTEMVGSADVRTISMMQDPKNPAMGTFVMTTTKLTQTRDLRRLHHGTLDCKRRAGRCGIASN